MTTVSHALSGKRPVNEETAQRIRAAIERLNYVPRAAARSLQLGRSEMIGLAVPDVSDPFFGMLAVSVERAADRRGYGVVLGSTSSASERDTRTFELLRSGTIDGLIYVAGDVRVEHQLLSLAGRHAIVLADEWVNGMDDTRFVTADQRAGGRLAAEHLLALGHRRIAVLRGPRNLRTAEERLGGVLERVPDAVVLDGDFLEPSAHAVMARMLDSGVRPSAVIAANDVSALGVMDAVAAAGLRVPEDISVVGFDDIPLAARVAPALTSIRQPIAEIGVRAVEVLLAVLDGRVPEPVPPLPVELVLRSSTAPPSERTENTTWPAPS